MFGRKRQSWSTPSVLGGWERTGVELDVRVRGRQDEALFLSVITVSELLRSLVTLNTREFARVPGLEVEQWS